jgi:hypothetical protein
VAPETTSNWARSSGTDIAGAGASSSGVPGTDTNPGTTGTPSYQTGTNTDQNYTNKEEKKNFEYDQKVTDSEKATGKMIPDESSMAISLWYGNKVKDDDHNIIDLEFTGEKLGDDTKLFNCIAQFVEDDSYIEMVGEDGDVWRWVFKNGNCEKVYSIVSLDY